MLLEQDQELIQVWVTGEVSSASHHRSGLFFTLQDPDEQAVIHCVVWQNQLDKLAILPVRGEQLILLGRLRLYPQRGHYQLMVWQVLPAGEGLRALRYRQVRDRLEAEGLFAPERKRPLPLHPQTIAVVTSPQAAAWGDIQRTLKSRYPGLRVLFSPALVQGEQAPASIVAAIERVERDGRAEVLILSRGGGATEDMACFNDERVVWAIAECSMPVIAGIGHQRDESLADLVADVYAHTPTAAAQQAVPQLSELYAQHQERVSSLYFAFNHHLEVGQAQLQRQKARLRRLQLDRQIAQEIVAIARMRQQLIQITTQRVQQALQHQQLLVQKLKTLDPQAVLKRGYAVVRQKNGQIVRQMEALESEQELSIQLGCGHVKVKVIEIFAASADAGKDV
jgi:exodeoxyribonuclease VII large subunit